MSQKFSLCIVCEFNGEQYLRKLTSNGTKPDVVFVDYMDCVVPTKQFKDEYHNQQNFKYDQEMQFQLRMR